MTIDFGFDRNEIYRVYFRLTEVASSGLIELQNRTRAGLEYAVSQQTVSSINSSLSQSNTIVC
jgi:hypothetical protein